MGTSISDIERCALQELVDIVSAISAFEGGRPSEFYRTERQKFVNGEIGADELHDRVVEYWSHQGS
jgi:hypothetical protein